MSTAFTAIWKRGSQKITFAAFIPLSARNMWPMYSFTRSLAFQVPKVCKIVSNFGGKFP